MWTNAELAPAPRARLEAGIAAGGHRLIRATHTSASVLIAGTADPALATADIAFGQPDAETTQRSLRLRWIALTSAGYTRFDNQATRDALRARGAILTNASSIFSEPCAQHILAMMLGLSRALPASLAEQLGEKRWLHFERRAESRLLNGQTVLLLSYGAIAKRLVELLAPFGMKIYALRRRAYSETGVHVIAEEKLSAVLPLADHLINILPENEGTYRYVNARRLASAKPGAFFYNIGRGSTVDEAALIDALENGRLGGAYLDVFDPEPLAASSRLWHTKNCWLTPHTAGGRLDQDEALVTGFLANLEKFSLGRVEQLSNLIR
ncbi:MAG: D-2-hydroxyacid dehydrogenase [Verrucomicrobia bacterium]|nr:MAG: D-2-hydroxyacid dehydrogenase [Verrucomicrobiota bacterium]